MTGGEIKTILADLGIRPSRKLGQNFLLDPNMRNALVADADPQPGERILEVGPGLGAMTERLLDIGCRVTAVELDHRLAEYLRSRLGDNPAFTLIQADACNVNYDELLGTEPYRCIANLPYSAGTVILTKLIAAANPPRELLILLQLEMARRLSALPRTKDYGALTVQVQAKYEVDITRRIPPNVFYPPPEVGSASVRLRVRKTGCEKMDADYEFFRRVLKTGFAQRRKRLHKLLSREFGQAAVDSAFEELALDPNTRAEELNVTQFKQLAERLK